MIVKRKSWVLLSLVAIICLNAFASTLAEERDGAPAYGPDNPYLRGRVLHMGNANGGWWKAMFKEERGKRYAYPLWTDEQLRQYVRMAHAFGFNGIEVWALDWEGLQYERAAITLCKAARELGMDTQLFMWGACGGITTNGGIVYRDFDWHKPEERAAIERFYDRQVFMAPHLTRIVTLWADPGQASCAACTIDTVVERHNAIAERFRARNPQIECFLSTWFLRPDLWPQYAGVASLAGNARLDKASGLALPSAGEIQAVSEAGRPVGIWSWYTTDVEIAPRMSVILNENTFRLSAAARERLAWFSVEDECQGVNLQNLFLAGRLMQNPWADARVLLKEYAQSYVGADAAPTVLEGLLLVQRYNHGLDLKYPTTPEGIEELEQMAVRLEKLAVNPAHVPPWPTPLSPQQYVNEIRGRLTAMLQWAKFQAGLAQLEALQKNGADPAAIEAALANLPSVDDDPTVAANPEPWQHRQIQPTLKKRFLEFPVVVAQSAGYNGFWSAPALLDGNPTTGWCSLENAGPPFEFIVDYGRLRDIGGIVFNNACQEDKYPGISAKEVSVFTGADNPRQCDEPAGRFELRKGAAKQRFDFAPRKARFVRLVIHSNWGNEQFTELMDVQVLP